MDEDTTLENGLVFRKMSEEDISQRFLSWEIPYLDVLELLDRHMEREDCRDCMTANLDELLEPLRERGFFSYRPSHMRGVSSDKMQVVGLEWEDLLMNLKMALLDMFVACRKEDGSLHHRELVVIGSDWYILGADEIRPYLNMLPRAGIRGMIFIRATGLVQGASF